jgi:beta-lactamase regulating signal transducer with metallopeptidase domain
LFVIWMAGFALGLVKMGLSALGLARWHRRSILLGRIGSDVELRMLQGIRGPVAAGVFRKVVFVPADWSGWDDVTRQAVLLHELSHHRRRDPLVRWFAVLATAAHWFNPLVYWTKRRLALQCEQACDRRVVGSGIRVDEYAEMLCRFASSGGIPATGLAMAEPSSLEARVRHLMGSRRSEAGRFVLCGMAGLLAVGGVLLPLAERKAEPAQSPDAAEVGLRLTANPFPEDP